MKTFDKKDVCTIVNAQTAYKYIGDNGYFSNHLDPDLRNWRYGELLSILNYDWTYIDNVFGIATQDPDNEEKLITTDYYGLFIPSNKVKEVEEPKKWRAFKSLDEFADALGVCHLVGTEIIFRNKGASELLRKSMITEMSTTSNNSFVTLGSLGFSLKSLFDAYEWLNKDGVWQPFGVLEK